MATEPAPQTATTAAAAKPTRAQMIADLEKIEAHPDDATAAPAADAKPAAAIAETSGETVEGDGAKEADKPADPDVELEAKGKDDKDAKPEGEADPETDKRLASIQKAEKRSRDQIAKERADARSEFQAEVERVKAEWSPKVEAAKAYEATKARARTDIVGHLRSLGYGEDDFEYAARQLYAHSTAAASDPKNRQAAEEARRRREEGDRVEQLQKRIDAMETEKRERETRETTERAVGEYIDGVAKAAADAPLFKRHLEASPAKAKARLRAIAERIAKATDEVPDAEDVLAAYEKERGAELAELGIDVSAIIKTKVPAPAATTTTQRSKTLDTTNGTATKPPADPSKLSPEQRRQKLLEEMPWGDA